jgi:hypothetical protein
MPKRSNMFQRLVLLIQHELGKEAVVQESVMLIDRVTGESREVDIVISVTVAGQPITIGVETIDRSRRATVEWVEQMEGKHRHLTDKLVLVSRLGFTLPARAKALPHGISLVNWADAATADWHGILRAAKFAELGSLHYDFKGCIASIILRDGQSLEQAIGPGHTIFSAEGQPIGSSSTIGQAWLNDPRFGLWLADRLRAEPTLDTLKIERDLPNGCYIEDRVGDRARVTSLRYEVRLRHETTISELSHAQYDDSHIVWGTASEAAADLTFIAREDARGLGNLVIHVASKAGGEPEVVQLAPFDPNNLPIANIIEVPKKQSQREQNDHHQ